MNILRDLQYGDLTEDLQMIYDVCGEKVVIQMIENLGGLSFYVPKITSNVLKEKKIQSNFISSIL